MKFLVGVVVGAGLMLAWLSNECSAAEPQEYIEMRVYQEKKRGVLLLCIPRESAPMQCRIVQSLSPPFPCVDPGPGIPMQCGFALGAA